MVEGVKVPAPRFPHLFCRRGGLFVARHRLKSQWIWRQSWRLTLGAAPGPNCTPEEAKAKNDRMRELRRTRPRITEFDGPE
jgi:hypothetical protein